MSKTQDIRLNIRVSPEELEIFKQTAAAHDKTLADWVRDILLIEAGHKEDRFTKLERRLIQVEEYLGLR